MTESWEQISARKDNFIFKCYGPERDYHRFQPNS
jgi:hypothetical protein